MPVSRPMPVVASGVHELRTRDETGVYRAFYFLKSIRGVLILHAFEKKNAENAAPGNRPGEKKIAGISSDRSLYVRKMKPVVTHNVRELARALGLSPADAMEIELRCKLNDKIIWSVNESQWTHA